MEFARRLKASMEDFARGDVSSTLALWSPEIRWFAAGKNPLAGRYVGHEQTLGYLADLTRLSSETLRTEILEVRPMFGQTYVARFRVQARTGDQTLDAQSSLIIDSEDGKVVSVVEVQHNEPAWDSFWTSAVAADSASVVLDTAGHSLTESLELGTA